MTPGPLLLFAGLCFSAGLVLGPRLARAWLALALAGAVAGFGAAFLVLGGQPDWEWRSSLKVGGEALHLRLDGVSAWFLLLLSVVAGAAAVYSRGYWTDGQHPNSAPRGRAWANAMALSMGWLLLSSNGLHFLIAWELFAVSGYFLVTLERRSHAARAAGWLYLATSHAGTLCLIAFFATLAARTGSWELGPMRGQTGLASLFWLALFGFGVKAGLFPLHVWLPSAHANAPSHVSAIMSGAAIKMGIYGIFRFSGWLPAPAAAGWIVIGMGAAGAVLGIALALAQNDLKRLLAYCSVENIGVIGIGLGGALLGIAHQDPFWGRLLLAGALLLVWNHGLFKALLFFSAGSVLHATGTREMSRLGGLWRNMPWTAGLFALGAAAICGLPPLNGFVSEWLAYLGMFEAATNRGPSGRATVPAAIILAMAGSLALAAFVKAGAVVFLGAPRTKLADRAQECGPWMRGPMLALAGACVAIGLAPVALWPALARAANAWRPFSSMVEPPAALAKLSLVNVTLAGLFLGAGAWLWHRSRANGLRRAATWDCGYAFPTARMQYTGGSFAGIAAGWFSWIFRPDRVVRRPRGPFPARASWRERVPDIVLERLIEPAGRAVTRFSTAARRLQHGRLQFYIAYLLCGLAVLAAIALLG